MNCSGHVTNCAYGLCNYATTVAVVKFGDSCDPPEALLFTAAPGMQLYCVLFAFS